MIPARAHSAARWLAPALALALSAVLARAAILFAMEHLSHESPWELVRHRLGVALPPLVLRASVVGLAACGIALRAARSGRRRTLLVLVPLTAAALWVLISGIGGADASRRVGLETTRGQAVAAGIAGVSLVLALGALGWATRPVADRAGSDRTVRLAAVAGFVLLVAVTLVGHFGLVGLAAQMPVRSVVVRPRFDDTWQVLRQRPDAPPRQGTITPSVDYGLDGADLPSVLLPPPSEVRFRAPAEGGLWLTARAGIDHLSLGRYEERFRGHAVRFELRVDDAVAFSAEVPFERVGKWAGSEWADPDDGGAVRVPAGAEIALATALLDPSGSPVDSSEVIDAGFGGITFEKRWTAPRRQATPEEPNLVLIVMDTQRADRMSVYGYERDTTPRLRELAERGVTFEEVHATSSWTWPSTASLLTGRLPHEHGVLSERSCFLDDELTTLAESLQQAGFTTGAFSANPLIVPDRNFHQGFEVFDHGRGAFRSSGVVVPPALEWLEAAAEHRFFLYLHLGDPHAPLEPLEEGRARFAADVPRDLDGHHINDCHAVLMEGDGHGPDGALRTEDAVPAEEQRWLSDLYDACVWSGDHRVGEVLDALERLGVADETVVAYTSDHGEELFDHGFATHGQNLHGSLVDVPLVVAGPGLPRGTRVATPVSNRHLAPSLARWVGAAPIGPPDAVDLLELPAAAPEVMFSTEKGWWNGRSVQPIHGWRRGDLVLHWAPRASTWGSDEPLEGGQVRLYDRSTDPGEERDLAAERPELAEELRVQLEARIAELVARRAAPSVAAGSSTLEMLEAIGYLEGGD